MMRVTLGLLVLAMAVAGFWFFTGGSSAISAPLATERDASKPAVDEVVSTKPANNASEKTATDAAENRQRVGSGESTGEILRVVDAATEEPVAGAQVGYFHDASQEFWRNISDEDRQAVRDNDIAVYRRLGRVHRTDVAGACRVVVPKRGLSVYVVSGELVGTGYLQLGKRPYVIKVQLQRTLIVRVKDAQGKPAEGLRIVMSPNEEEPSSRTGIGVTDSTGEARKRNIQFWWRNGESVVAIEGSGYGVTTERRVVDLAVTRETIVELSLPAAGSITFELRSTSGQPYGLAGLDLPILGFGVSKSLPARRSDWNIEHQTARFGRDGRAIVRHVGLDHHFACHASPLLSKLIVGKGPTTRQPHLVVPIVIPEALVIFRGRAVDAAGQAITTGTVGMSFFYKRGRSGQQAKFGADGRFAIPQPHMPAKTDVEIFGGVPRGELPQLVYVREEPWTVRPGINDLGDCVFVEAPTLLSGRLVVPEALSDLEQIYWTIESKRRRWLQRHDLRTTWLPDRRFEIRGAVALGSPLRLVFQRGAYAPMEPLEFRAGDKDVEIELPVGGDLEATFLVDPFLAKTPLQLKLDPEFQVKELGPRAQRTARIQSRNHLYPTGPGRMKAFWKGLQPGRYQLVLTCPGMDRPLVDLPGIEVGGKVPDPRVKDIDLRGRLREVAIRLRAAGEPVPDGKVQVMLADLNGEDWYTFRQKQGVVKLPIAGSARVRVLVPGYRFVDLAGVQTDRVIELERAKVVRFRFRFPTPLPEGVSPQLQVRPILDKSERRVRVHGGSGSGLINNVITSTGFLDREGRVSVAVIYPGPHGFRLAMDPHGRGYYIYSIKPRTIDPATAGAEEIELTVNGKRVEEALQKLKQP